MTKFSDLFISGPELRKRLLEIGADVAFWVALSVVGFASGIRFLVEIAGAILNALVFSAVFLVLAIAVFWKVISMRERGGK